MRLSLTHPYASSLQDFQAFRTPAQTWRLDALRRVVDDVEEEVVEAEALVARTRHEGVTQRLQLADGGQVHLAQGPHHELLPRLLLRLLLLHAESDFRQAVHARQPG